MVKNLSHNNWVLQQFEDKYLKASYRNVLIHSSIIEGVLRNESGENGFKLAIKFLFDLGKITDDEFKKFDDIRNTRNCLVHDSFRNGLDQKDIDNARDDLMKKIHGAYRVSNFLNEKLFEKYQIVRPSRITFKP